MTELERMLQDELEVITKMCISQSTRIIELESCLVDCAVTLNNLVYDGDEPPECVTKARELTGKF